jgi:hypothetical protein
VEPESSEVASDAAVADPTLRAVLDRVEAVDRELQAAEETRRSRAEELARLAIDVEREVTVSLAVATVERTELEERLRDVEKRIADLEATRSRYVVADPTETDVSAAGTASDGSLIPQRESSVAIPIRVGNWEHGDRDTAPSTEAIDASQTSAGPAVPGQGEHQGDGAYEEAWYDVLKQPEA